MAFSWQKLSETWECVFNIQLKKSAFIDRISMFCKGSSIKKSASNDRISIFCKGSSIFYKRIWYSIMLFNIQWQFSTFKNEINIQQKN